MFHLWSHFFKALSFLIYINNLFLLFINILLINHYNYLLIIIYLNYPSKRNCFNLKFINTVSFLSYFVLKPDIFVTVVWNNPVYQGLADFYILHD